ncbi:membrane protein [Sphaerisporangium siamense]|uniref:RND superfamily putative drug exporter n=1 Tax=Sphaerisporangium siamense TaxID=795645 RepID=A0A7W7DDZ1_9ACTN|nr:MMPL family transporter [Sphaerisporangium siamense]MBB4705104.1 RND superfamily putative drug exporter [Sphaerisporangium siamense]GII83910.1 membrane protein [Sphaerisporangium siamense]
MFAKLGRFAAGHRLWVLAAAVLFVVIGGAWGSGAGGILGGGAGLDAPGSESAQANRILAGTLGRHVPDVVVIYESPAMTVDDPRFRQAVEQVAARVPKDAYVRLETYWSTGSADFVSRDKHKTYLALQLPGATEEEQVVVYRNIAGLFDAPGLTERTGGLTAIGEQFNTINSRDLSRAELISFPFLIILLLLVFRGVVAAALPLAVAVVVAVGSLSVLRVVGGIVDLSTAAINVVVILGLGLATDYALLILTRFREELAAGRTVDDAVSRAMGSAGRTVAVSGLTVAVTLGGLVVFPSRFLTSLAYSGVAVVLFAVIAALTVLPALLRLIGRRVDALRLPLPWLRGDRPQGRRWYRVAHGVMRRPFTVVLAVGLALVTLGLPLLGVVWSRPGEWAMPGDVDGAAATRQLAEEFPYDPTKVVTTVVRMPGPATAPGAQAALADFAGRLGRIDGVDRAAVTGASGNLARITLGYSMSSYGAEMREVVAKLRAEPPPAGATALFTNRPASIADMLDMIGRGLPWMLLIVVVVTFVVMFLAFGSVTLPLKSIVMNLLSLSAAFGAMVLIFQNGFLSGLLGFTAPGFLDANMPVLIGAVSFGLAMDYEVFMLARIREEYLRTGDPVESVALGVRHTAGVITAAALLLGVVLAAFVTTSITVIKMIGVGSVIALLVDATIVRGLLVPATMRLLGRHAWWSPEPLARWWLHHGLPEESAAAPPPAPRPASTSARV